MQLSVLRVLGVLKFDWRLQRPWGEIGNKMPTWWMLGQELWCCRHGKLGQDSVCQVTTLLLPELPEKEFTDGWHRGRALKRANRPGSRSVTLRVQLSYVYLAQLLDGKKKFWS